MGGRSVGGRALQERLRHRIVRESMKDLMESKASMDRSPPTRDEIKCQSCNFKARYKFIRCPECNEVQK